VAAMCHASPIAYITADCVLHICTCTVGSSKYMQVANLIDIHVHISCTLLGIHILSRQKQDIIDMALS